MGRTLVLVVAFAALGAAPFDSLRSLRAREAAPLHARRGDASHQQANAPLPDREPFLADARKRLASNAVLQSRFTYRERGTTVRMNPFGRIGTGPVETYEVYPLPDNLTYRRLIERDGVPVSREALAAADRSFLARYHEWRRTLAREGQSEREVRLARQAAAREKDRAQAEEVTALFEFALDRRETFEGQPAIVVAFRPKAAARPRSREARVASTFSGRAWVHEHEREVMRVEAEANTDTAFGFGIIARLHKGAKAVFTRRKIGDAWLPTLTRVTGTGRALLVRKVDFVYSREYSDYKPFDPAEITSILAASTGSK